MTNAANKTTWSRLVPKQFSLRGLLVLITLAALCIWWWVQLPIGFISEADTHKVKLGLNRAEVVDLLGEPVGESWSVTPSRKHTIEYYVVGSKPKVRAFVVELDNQTSVTTNVTREQRDYYPFTEDR